MRLLSLVALGPALLLLGCGGASIEELCQRSCECLGNCDTQQADCEKSGKAYQDLADEVGCRDAWDAYLSCLDDELTCVDGKIDESACSSELDTFETECSTSAG